MELALVLAVLLSGCGRVSFDALATDASIDTPSAPLCDRVTDYLYCNDFNTPDFKGAFNNKANYVDNAGVDGSGAIVFVAPPNSSASFEYTFTPFVTSGELHIGARMFIEGTAPPMSFLVLAQFGGEMEKSSFDAVGDNNIQLVDTLGTDSVFADGLLPRERWFCMELAVGVSNGPGSFLRGYVDGAMILEGYIGMDTLPDEAYQTAQLAAYGSTTLNGTFVVHHDNFIVSTHPIGCP